MDKSFVNQNFSGFAPNNIEGMNRHYGIYIGFVKANADAQNMGRLQVYIPDLGGDPNNSSTWHTVSYASPFAGATDVENNKDGGQDMASTQISYGWWAVPPDINNQVAVFFSNGDPGKGYWFACVFQQFMNQMVPGIAAGESTDGKLAQGGNPPVCEYNKKDPQQAQNFWQPKRPAFTPLMKGFDNQGLGADPERGPATTSARREAPSQVFGFNSPRGNTIHIDDNPQNEFIRLRTRSGAQILIHETSGYIYMISRDGNSWMEISDIGIDMYSARSISMRAEENINMYADSCILMHGIGAVHTTGGNITRSSKGRIVDISCGEQIRHSPRIKDNSKSSGGNGQTAGSPGTGSNGAQPKSSNDDSTDSNTKTQDQKDDTEEDLKDGSASQADTDKNDDRQEDLADGSASEADQKDQDTKDDRDSDLADGSASQADTDQAAADDAREDHDTDVQDGSAAPDESDKQAEASQDAEDMKAAEAADPDRANPDSKALTKEEMDAQLGQSYPNAKGHTECVTAVQKLGMTANDGTPVGPASTWRKGDEVNEGNWMKFQGQAVATSNKDGGTAYDPINGGQGGNATHTGILYGWDSQRNGPILLNQYNSAGQMVLSTYPVSGKYGTFSTIAH